MIFPSYRLLHSQAKSTKDSTEKNQEQVVKCDDGFSVLIPCVLAPPAELAGIDGTYLPLVVTSEIARRVSLSEDVLYNE